MRHARGLITTTEALQQVFNFSVRPPSRPALQKRWEIAFCPSAQHLSTSGLRQATYQPISGRPESSSQRLRGRASEAREIDLSKFGLKTDRPLWDEEITVERAYVKLPDNTLSQVQSLEDILDGRAKDEDGKFTQYVKEIAAADPANGREYTILGYFDKKEIKVQKSVLKKKNKQSVTKEKSIELGWSIDENDLQHRLSRLKAFLEKGNRVEVAFGTTRLRGWGSKKKMTEEEAQELLSRFRQAALEVEGTKVTKELNGKLLGQAAMSFQGPGRNAKEADEEKETILQDT